MLDAETKRVQGVRVPLTEVKEPQDPVMFMLLVAELTNGVEWVDSAF